LQLLLLLALLALFRNSDSVRILPAPTSLVPDNTT